MVSTFLKSFSVSTALLDTPGASKSTTTPNASDRVHRRRGPAAERRSGAHAGAVTPPANLAIDFHAAVAPIGSTSKRPSTKHSAPWPGLLGVRTGLTAFLAANARFPAAPSQPVWLFCVGFCVLFARTRNRAVRDRQNQRPLAAQQTVPGSMTGPGR